MLFTVPHFSTKEVSEIDEQIRIVSDRLAMLRKKYGDLRTNSKLKKETKWLVQANERMIVRLYAIKDTGTDMFH